MPPGGLFEVIMIRNVKYAKLCGVPIRSTEGAPEPENHPNVMTKIGFPFQGSEGGDCSLFTYLQSEERNGARYPPSLGARVNLLSASDCPGEAEYTFDR